MNEYYTYAYLREDGTPYYIGKGKGYRATSKKGHFYVPPEDRIIYLKCNLTEQEAFRHEIYMIDVLGRKDLGTGILRNRTDGGEGASGVMYSEETRDKCRAASYKRKTYGSRPIGYKHKKESKDKMSKTYKLTWENGSSVVVTNLDEWCRQNGYQRRNLTYVKHGKRRQHKGIVTIEELA
jgi:hypothetical protein